jgi:hypothetical protein
MLPDFTSDGLLPPGEHLATWDEISNRFGWNPRRQSLLAGLSAALIPLRTAGCGRIFLDGSFVTDKELPGDYDAAWDLAGVDLGLLHVLEPVFFNFDNQRAAQKAKYLGEFFPASYPADLAGTLFREFFQRDKNTGGMKGIVVLQP